MHVLSMLHTVEHNRISKIKTNFEWRSMEYKVRSYHVIYGFTFLLYMYNILYLYSIHHNIIIENYS